MKWANEENQLPIHQLPKGVIGAGMRQAEDFANTTPGINIDAVAPVPLEKGRLTKLKNKAARLGRLAVDRMGMGSSVSWHDHTESQVPDRRKSGR